MRGAGPCRREHEPIARRRRSRSSPAPAFPAVFFLLAAAGVLELDTAFTIAKWSGPRADRALRLLGGAARRRAARTRRSLHAGAVALIGAFVIALKALVH